MVFKSRLPFTDCMGEMNNARVDNARDLDVVIPMYNLMEYIHNFSQTSGSLWKFFRDKRDNTALKNSESFKSKERIRGSTPAASNTKDVEIPESLKYLSNFWRTLEIP